MSSDNSQKPVVKKRWYVLFFVIIVPFVAGLDKIYDFYCNFFDCDKPCEEGEVYVSFERNNKEAVYEFNQLLLARYPEAGFIDGASKYDNLVSYYVTANQDFFNEVDNLTSLNFIMAPAGLGKSLIFRELKSNVFDDSTYVVHKISLNEICKCSTGSCDEFIMKPQLSNNFTGWEYDFNTLPFKKSISISNLLNISNTKLDTSKVNLIFIDGCDEWHPNAIDLLIKSANKFIGEKKFATKFIMFGRPEGFQDFFRDSNRPPFNKFNKFFLNSPLYTTKGDLRLRIRDYKKFEAPHLDTNLVFNRIMALDTSSQSFIKEELRNLQSGNYILEEFNKTDFSSEDVLKKNLFEAYLVRNRGTHCRPESDNNLYVSLLQTVARRYLSETDEKGYFRVNGDDRISAKYCINGVEKLVEVEVQDLLEFSGIVNYMPLSSPHATYTFAPSWIHSYLVEL